jgi:N-formylglutamate amidohydrolase
MTTQPPPFEVLPPVGAPRAIVGHVPHSSTHVPSVERARLLVDDATLDRELLRLTDAHTDRLFAWIRDLGGTLVVNRTSRLVVDPERFPDDTQEPMATVGQGAVYTRTTDGQPLRTPDDTERARLLATFFEPYHAALTAAVQAQLTRDGQCLVLDGHSFATVPLPSEADQDPERPDLSLGTDPFHTPNALVEALALRLRDQGFRVMVDRPFAGTIVPLRWYGTDPSVTSVMLEVRRGLYMDEATGEPLPAFDDVAARLEQGVGLALGF